MKLGPIGTVAVLASLVAFSGCRPAKKSDAKPQIRTEPSLPKKIGSPQSVPSGCEKKPTRSPVPY